MQAKQSVNTTFAPYSEVGSSTVSKFEGEKKKRSKGKAPGVAQTQATSRVEDSKLFLIYRWDSEERRFIRSRHEQLYTMRPLAAFYEGRFWMSTGIEIGPNTQPFLLKEDTLYVADEDEFEDVSDYWAQAEKKGKSAGAVSSPSDTASPELICYSPPTPVKASLIQCGCIFSRGPVSLLHSVAVNYGIGLPCQL